MKKKVAILLLMLVMVMLLVACGFSKKEINPILTVAADID